MGHSLEPRVPIPLEELLRHADWLRRLAAGLVADPGRADDLVQDTWLAALRRPPLAGAPARPWLERVFRNLARNRRRDERTRAEHEPQAGAPRPSPGPAEIAQEVEAQRVLAEAVGRLSDPARTIVVLRYFRGLDASAIGRELALPPGTVRWRLKAALEELRHELDRRFEGGRKAWSLALARVLAAAAPPAASVSLAWLGAAAAVLVVAGGGWWSLRRSAPAEVAAVASEQVDPESARTREQMTPPRVVEGEVEAAGVQPRNGTTRVPRAGSSARPDSRDEPDIAGAVLVDGAPAERSIHLELEFGYVLPGMPGPSGLIKRKLGTDDAGRFEAFVGGQGAQFLLRAPGYLLESEDPIWAVPSRVTPDRDVVLLLRTPPAIRGRVVTSGGEPVPRAHGVYELHADTSEMLLDSGRGELDCDGEGRFELTLLDLMSEGMPRLRADETWEGTLLFEVPRVGRRLLELGPARPVDLDLGDVVLAPVRVLAFQVRDERGLPLSGAVARLDDHWITVPSSPTNREGRGELRHVPGPAARVRFSALGYADRVLVPAPGEQPVVWLDPVGLLEVQLEPPANTYGPFPDVVLTAHAELFEPVDAPRWKLSPSLDPIQAELGATGDFGLGRRKNQDGLLVTARFQPDPGGKVLVTGLRPDVAFTVEARDATRRVLASRELTLTAGERRRLALPYGE